MVKKTDPPLILFVSSAILISAGWLIPSFPLFIFFGFAPLFALADRTEDSTSVWEKMEWVLLGLCVSFIAARSYNFNYSVSSILFGILFTLPFIGHVWVKQTLGKKAGKITIIFFWLAIEYILLKTIPAKSVFLADAIRSQPEWMRWNVHTGFLGASLWILLVNLLVCQAALSGDSFKWSWIILAALLLVGPAVYSLLLEGTPISREEMVGVYAGKSTVKDVTYLARNEFIVRTAAWLSTLIILFTFVKSQTVK